MNNKKFRKSMGTLEPFLIAPVHFVMFYLEPIWVPAGGQTKNL